VNILLVPINDLKSHPTETRFISMGKSLVDLFGVNINVLHYRRIPTESKTNRKLYFDVLTFGDLKTKNLWSYYVVNALPMFFALSKAIKEKKIDVIIHANILPSTIAVCLGKVFHVPVIFDYQDHFPESASAYYKEGLTKSLIYTFVSKLNKINVDLSDAVVTVTNAHHDMIRKLNPKKMVKVIPNGVNIKIFRPIPKDIALKNLKTTELNQKFVITYFGSIDTWMDFTTVFKALRQLMNEGLSVLFLIIGYSHSRFFLDELKEIANSMGVGNLVHFVGTVSLQDLVYYINVSDVTIAPYRQMTKNQVVSLKILESLACGVPVCTTGMQETVERFKGFVNVYSTEEELESALRKYVKRKTMVSSEDMRKIAAGYTWDISAVSYYELLMGVITKYTEKPSALKDTAETPLNS
jgi:glycosyltransferase involved in cell wall biosynthesis